IALGCSQERPDTERQGGADRDPSHCRGAHQAHSLHGPDHTDQIASARCGTEARRDAFSALDTPSVLAMNADHIKGRLHDAMHRGSHKATEEELAEVTAVVLAIVGELGAEMAVLIADLEARVEALEGSS